ncbi:MAG: recombinase RecT [Mesorhizobium sp.]
MNQLVPADQTSTREIGIAVGAGGASIAPQNLGEVVRFAEVMCRADIALPKHLRGNAGACMAVALQALEWQMSPFAVASKSYAVNGAIAYEAQLIAAVVNTRSGIKGRLRYEFIGDGNDLSCKVTGTLDGQECEYETPPIGAITTKNSPLWKSDPRQQLGYFAARSWARRHCPEVILGVYDRDEAEHFGPTTAKDVTPSVMTRLQAKQEAPQTREGFDQSFVTRETAALTGEADSTQTEDNSQSSDTPSPSDEAAAEPKSPALSVAADISPDDESGKEEGDNTGQVTTEQAAPSSTYSRADCVKAFMQTATDAALTVPERRELLAEMKDWWKDALSDDLPFVKDCLTTADKVSKGELQETAARKYLDAIPAPKGGA